jgi:hypothetical protein
MGTKDRFAPPSAEDAATIRRLVDLIDAFRQIEPSMPTSYVAGFLAVAGEPGQGVTHYARTMGVIVPVASRILLEMGKKTRTGGPGHGLVDSVQASDDLRQWNFYVTPRGQKLLDRCFALMNQRKP